MHRYLHPLAFFASVLLMIGLILSGAVNALACRQGCSPSGTDVRVRVALALLAPGILLAVAAWDIALTAQLLRRSWRAAAALFGLPLVFWTALLISTPSFRIPGLGAGSAGGLVTALTAGAFTLFTLTCILFVVPTPSESSPRPAM